MAREVHDHDSAEGLVPLDEARERVLSQVHPLPPIELPLTDAYGCVAAGDVTSVIDLPEFASSGMDGFAVRAADLLGASPEHPVELKVVAVLGIFISRAGLVAFTIAPNGRNCIGTADCANLVRL